MEEAERRWTSSLPRGLHGETAEQRGFVVEEMRQRKQLGLTLRTLPEPSCEEGHGGPVGLQGSFRSGSFGLGPDDRL